jgi:hypothetical protein
VTTPLPIVDAPPSATPPVVGNSRGKRRLRRASGTSNNASSSSKRCHKIEKRLTRSATKKIKEEEEEKEGNHIILPVIYPTSPDNKIIIKTLSVDNADGGGDDGILIQENVDNVMTVFDNSSLKEDQLLSSMALQNEDDLLLMEDKTATTQNSCKFELKENDLFNTCTDEELLYVDGADILSLLPVESIEDDGMTISQTVLMTSDDLPSLAPPSDDAPPDDEGMTPPILSDHQPFADDRKNKGEATRYGRNKATPTTTKTPPPLSSLGPSHDDISTVAQYNGDSADSNDLNDTNSTTTTTRLSKDSVAKQKPNKNSENPFAVTTTITKKSRFRRILSDEGINIESSLNEPAPTTSKECRLKVENSLVVNPLSCPKLSSFQDYMLSCEKASLAAKSAGKARKKAPARGGGIKKLPRIPLKRSRKGVEKKKPRKKRRIDDSSDTDNELSIVTSEMDGDCNGLFDASNEGTSDMMNQPGQEDPNNPCINEDDFITLLPDETLDPTLCNKTVEESNTKSSHSTTPRPTFTSSSSFKLDSKLLQKPERCINFSDLCNYLVNFNRWFLAKQHSHDIIVFLKAISNSNYTNAAKDYLCLRKNHSLHFSVEVLTPLLELCSKQSVISISPNPSFVAFEILEDLKKIGNGKIDINDHLNFIKTLITYRKFSDVSKSYKSMSSLGLKVTAQHLQLMLNVVTELGPCSLQLLEDAVNCFDLNDLAIYLDKFIVLMNERILKIYIVQIENWIRVNLPVIALLSPQTVLVLLRSLVKCCKILTGAMIIDCYKHRIGELGDMVVDVVERVLCQSHNNEIKQIVEFITCMSHDQYMLLKDESWEQMLCLCVELRHVKSCQWVFDKAVSLNKPLSKKVLYELFCLYLNQDSDHLTEVLKQFLSIPLPSPVYLLNLCQYFKNRPSFIVHLYSVFLVLIELKTPPPQECLEWFLMYHLEHREIYDWLADIVRQMTHNMIHVDYNCYEKIMLELYKWDGIDRSSRSSIHSPISDDNLHQMESSTSGLGSSPEFSTDSMVNGMSFSLDGVLQDANSNREISSLLSLIEQSGSQGQFGAVAAVISNLPSIVLYTSKLLHGTLNALLNSSKDDYKAFEELLNSLSLMRCKKDANDNGLRNHDLWLIGQLGVALLFYYTNKAMWNEGFRILHCLHLYGIHYVGLSQPHSMDPPPTPCAVALRAIECCLQVNQLSSIMQVLNGCQFISCKNDTDKEKKSKTLVLLTSRYQSEGSIKEALMCLKALLTDLPSQFDKTLISDLLVELIHMIETDKTFIKEVSNVVTTALKLKMTVSYESFSKLVNVLSTVDGSNLSELVKLAVEADVYHCLETTPTHLVLPFNMSEMEIKAYLSHHLVKHSSIRQLEICCPTAMSSKVELSLSSHFVPPLKITQKITLSPTNVNLVIYTPSLSSWFLANTSEEPKKKTFRRLICKYVLAELEPYKENKKIKTSEDHKHLVDIISHRLFKQGKATNWMITDAIITKLKSLVKHIMDSVTCYTSQTNLSDILIKAP